MGPLHDIGAWLAAWVADRDVPESASQATRIDRIAELERVQASVDA